MAKIFVIGIIFGLIVTVVLIGISNLLIRYGVILGRKKKLPKNEK